MELTSTEDVATNDSFSSKIHFKEEEEKEKQKNKL